MADEVHEHVNSYVEATARACARSRDVLVVIIIVSVLIFGAFWNSRTGSWINTRVSVAVDALALLRLKERVAAAAAQRDVGAVTQLESETRDERFDRARQFLKERPYWDVNVAAANVRKLADMQTEHVAFLRLPFFGLVVDVNDLGMLGGFAFTVLLLWMRFVLVHEKSSLETTFNDAKSHANKIFCYEVLAMQQVLTTPPSLGERRRSTIWSKMAKTLVLLPLVVQLTVFCYDSFSFRLGWSLSPSNTVINTAVSLVFLIFIAVLTSVCFSLWTIIENLWATAAQEIVSDKPVRETRHD